MIFSREEWLSFEHLCENAARTPDIYLDVIFLPREHDLWGAVVSCGDIASHLGILNTGQTEIADLEVTIFVDEDITGFQITMDDAGRMNIL